MIMKAFTLIEILLTLAICSVLFAFSVPVYQLLQTRNDMEVGANTIAQNYRRAQLLSQAVNGDANWGVNVQRGHITIFKGTDYATRDASFDEDFDLPTSITVSGETETVFAKFTGLPESAGTVVLTARNNETREITVNEKGIVTY